jgi:hypothetical protein
MVAANSFSLCTEDLDAGPGIFKLYANVKITGHLIRRRVRAEITGWEGEAGKKMQGAQAKISVWTE